MLTITSHNKKTYIHQSELDVILYKLQKSIELFKVGDFSYEVSGIYHQLHFHGLVTVLKSFRYSPQWTSLDGFQLKWKKVFNKRRAINYIYKDQNGSRNGVKTKYARNQESIIFENKCRNENLFSEPDLLYYYQGHRIGVSRK